MSVFLFSPFFPQRLSSFFFLFFFLSLSLSLPVYCSFRYGNPNLTPAAINAKERKETKVNQSNCWHSGISGMYRVVASGTQSTDKGLRHTDYTRIYKEHKGSSSFLPLYAFDSISPSGGGWHRARLSCFVASMRFIL